MLNGKDLSEALGRIQSLLDDVNSVYIRKIAQQIEKVGHLSQTSINRMIIMAEVTSDAEDVKKALQKATGKTKAEMEALYQRAMRETYTDPRFTAAYGAGRTLPKGTKKALEQLTQQLAAQTGNRLDNFSNTTLIDKTYRDTVDKAITAVRTGLGSYDEAIREVLKQVALSGVVVQYPSGARRRIDTAVRMNVIDGAKQISQQGADMMGKALNYNAKEISAHAHSAPDHEPVQGHILLLEEWEKMQAGYPFKDWKGRHFDGFARPIGQWNCMHFGLPFDTELSIPRYTEQELQSFIELNQIGIDMNGKHYTIYEASQLMRGLECQIRGWKDAANAAKITGDITLRRQCQYQIDLLTGRYKRIANLSGIMEDAKRMSVAGFRPVKAVAPPPRVQKPAQPKAPPPPPDYFGKALEGYSDEAKAKIKEYMDKAPPEVKAVWAKFSPQFKEIKAPDPKNGNSAYYDHGDGHVHMEINVDSSERDIKYPHQTFFHEFGHNIDNLKLEGKYSYFSDEYRAKDGSSFKSHLESDIDQAIQSFADGDSEILRTAYIDDLREKLEEQEKYGGMGTQHYLGQILSMYRRKRNISSDDYFDLRDELANAVTSNNKTVRVMDGLGFMWEHSDVLKFFYNDNKKLQFKALCQKIEMDHSISDSLGYTPKVKELGDLSDIMSGYAYPRFKMNYVMGVGHKGSYWTYDSSLPIEAFAEFMSSAVMQGESISILREYLPTSYDFFMEMLKEMVK